MFFNKKLRAKISRFVIIMLFVNLVYGYLPMGNLSVSAVDTGNFQFITGVELTDENGQPFTGNIDKNSKLRITYLWDIPDEIDISEGESYELRIPQEIKILEEKTIPLEDSTGEALANVNLRTDGSIQITYTSYGETLSGISGYFYVYSEFDETKIGTEEETAIVFDLGGNATKTIYVTFNQPEQNSEIRLAKAGDYNAEKNEITWRITARPQSTPANVPITGAIIVDTIPAGQSYIVDSAKVSAASSGAVVATGGAISWDGANTLQYAFDSDINLTQNEIYFIEFKTKPELSAFDSEDKTIIFKNQASALYEGKTSVSNVAEVNTKVDFINKTGVYQKGGTILWTITVNNNKLTIPDAALTDQIPKGLTLKEDTITLNGTKVSIVNPGGPLTYDSVSQSLSYAFGSISNTNTLTYVTEVTDPEAYNSNTEKVYTNQAKLDGIGVPSNANIKVSVGVPTNVIEKNGAGYNRSTHIITWKITVNSNEIAIEDAIVSDNIPTGLAYVENSFKVDGVEPAGDFSYTADSGSSVKTGSFTYKFPTVVTDKHVITYQTRVLSNTVYAVNGSRDFQNTVILKGSNIPDSSSTTSQNVTSEMIQKVGTGYDHITREATWTITVNQNEMLLENGLVEDVISSKHEFVEGSVKINGTPAVKGASANEINAYYYDETSRSFTYRFSSTDKTQIITFKTLITDLSIFESNGDKQLVNKATLHGDDIPPNVSSEDKIDIPNVLISKIHNYKSGDAFIPWEVDINQNQLPISDAVLEDQLQEGLELDTESVHLYELVVAENGAYVRGDEITLSAENVKYIGETRNFEFHFNQSINKAYRLTFKTDIDPAYNNSSFANTIRFKGSHGEEHGTSSTFSVNFQTSGGSAVGANGSIRVTKVDEVTKETLPGAVFELLDKNGNVLKTSQPTGNDGAVLFDKLKFRTYSIREKTAPTGYALEETPYTFTLKNEDGAKDILYFFDNSKIKGNMEFKKVTEQGEALPGAEFTLYASEDTSYEFPLATAIIDEQGLVRFEDVVFGNYIIKETTAPAGYLLSNILLTVSITEQGVTVTVSPEGVPNIIIKGNLKIIKKDADTLTPLADAVFSLYTEKDVFLADLKTDETGEVIYENLPYGKYYVIEKTAPKGYQGTFLKYNVIIDSVGEQSIEITNESLRTLRIRKSEVGNTELTLKGAEFEIRDKSHQIIEKVVTDETGEAEVKGLSFGIYYIKEVKAPSGYVMDEVEHEISITKENTSDHIYVYNVSNVKKPVTPGGGDTPEVPGTPGVPETPSVPGEETPKPTPEVTPSPEAPKPTDKPENGEKEPTLTPKPDKEPERKEPEKVIHTETTPKNKPKKGKVVIPKEGSAKVSKEPEHGKAVLDSKGNWDYTPKKEYVGTDNFSIVVTDKKGNEKEYYFEIGVQEVPLGGFKVDNNSKEKTLPKTGENSRMPYYISGVSLLALGLLFRKKAVKFKRVR